MVKNYKKYILLLVLSIVAVAFICSVGIKTDFLFGAEASEIVSTKEITYTKISKITNGIAEYVSGVSYVDGYAKDVHVVFSVDAPYYNFEYSIDGSDLIEEAILPTPANGEVEFIGSVSGQYSVTCYAYADEMGMTELGKSETSFKNDVTSPSIPQIEPMTEWKRSGIDYDVEVDWSECYDVSGIYGIYYYYTYSDATQSTIISQDVNSLEKSILKINRNCVLTIICYDKSGNATTKDYTFEKFDDVAPPQPTYTITPELNENSLSRSYTITVNYPLDTQSGLLNEQKYILNGSTYVYDGSIILDSMAANYSIRLYSMDNAGNRSEYVDILVKNTNFDLVSPSIEQLSYSIDTLAGDVDKLCTVSLTASDNGSGIATVYAEGLNKYFAHQNTSGRDIYTLSFAPYGIGTLTLKVTDNAGNVTTRQMIINHFADLVIADNVKAIVNKSATLNESDYTEKLWKKVTSAYEALDLVLIDSNKTAKDINDAIADVNALINTTIVKEYKIINAPEIVSGIISYTVDENDFVGTKRGDVVTLTLDKSQADGVDYKDISGYSSAFYEKFKLDIKYNAEALASSLNNGITINMNVPVNYYDREMTIIDANTKQKLDVEIKNNVIIFNVKNSGEYVLVISGNKAISGNNDVSEKTIEVFGNVLKQSTFFAIVGSIAAVTILVVGALVFLLIRKNR